MADETPTPERSRRSTATQFFLKGLATSLPPILTIVILIWIAQGLYAYIINPISFSVKFSIASFMDKSRTGADGLERLENPPELDHCGTFYWVTGDLAAKLKQAGDATVELTGTDLDGVYVPIPFSPAKQTSPNPELGGKAVPFADFKLVSENVDPDEIPRNVQAFYMVVATQGHFQGQFLLSAFAISIAIVLLYFLGRIVTIRLGAWAVGKVESLFVGKLPLVSNVYSSVKQVTDFLFTERTIEYNRIVSVEYPRRGIWSLGFVTGESMLEITAAAGEPLVTVLIPTSPMPVTGYTINIPKNELIDLNITIDQAFQFCISCGVLVPEQQAVTPELLQQALARRLNAEVDRPSVTRPQSAGGQPAADPPQTPAERGES